MPSIRPALLVITLCMGSTASAQDVPAALSGLLKRARSSGALEARVLGERTFREARLGDTARAITSIEGDDALRCEVEISSVGGMREERFSMRALLGFDGRTRSVGMTLVRGRDRIEASGSVEGETLTLTVRESRGEETHTRTAKVAWGPDCLPAGVLAFVIAPLADPQLAPLRCRVFQPASLSLQPEPCVLTVDAEGVSLEGFVPGAATRVLREGDRITEVRMGPATYRAAEPKKKAD